MDEVVQHLPGVSVYLDDLLVASASPLQHLEHLQQLFQALKRFGLVINPEKCVFGVKELEFLGHMVDHKGIQPLQAKVQAIIEYRAPQTIKALQRFQGMIHFFRRFLPQIEETLRTLTDALIGSPRQLMWTSTMTSAFEEAKQRLAKATLLAHPIKDADLRLYTDASSKAIAGTVQQYIKGRLQPLAFFSRRTTKAESRYSEYYLELLAIYSSIHIGLL